MTVSLFALGIGVRAVLLGGIAFAVMKLIAARELYAVALVVTGIGALVLADLARHIAKGDRMLARFIDGVVAEDFERPARTNRWMAGFRWLPDAIERASAAITAARSSRQQQIDYLRTLIDNVSAALFMVNANGVISLANRTAHALAGQSIYRLQECVPIGIAAAERLLLLQPGERTILRLANGQRVLASAAWFSAAGVSHRLLSLENIGSELDAVELKAWQDLVRILSHEMMNSLTPIVSLAESARAATGSDVVDAIDTISRRSRGLMNFVERYRKVADLPQPARKLIRIDELFSRLQRFLNPLFLEKGIECSSRIESQSFMISADAELLEQALINLIHNAIDATNGVDNPSIKLTARQHGNHVEISVSDNGPGLDPQSVDRIFVPFFTTKSGGSGIGLALARQIALAHGGRLDVSPNVPRGAIFTLTLIAFDERPFVSH